MSAERLREMLRIKVRFVRIGAGKETTLGDRVGVYSLVADDGVGYVGNGKLVDRIGERRKEQPELASAPAFVADCELKKNAVIVEWLLIAVTWLESKRSRWFNNRYGEKKKVREYLSKHKHIQIGISGRNPWTGERTDEPIKYCCLLLSDEPFPERV